MDSEVCSVHQATDTAQHLNRLAQQLQSEVRRFKIWTARVSFCLKFANTRAQAVFSLAKAVNRPDVTSCKFFQDTA